MGYGGMCPIELAYVHQFGNFYLIIIKEPQLHISPVGSCRLLLTGLPWGLNFNPHTHPIPIPMGIPIPTAAMSILHHFRDKARYWSKIVIFSYPVVLDAPVMGSPSDYCLPVWFAKTSMMGLPGGEKSLTICLLVSTECTNVTDRQTHRQTPHDGKGRAWCKVCAAKRQLLPGPFHS